MNEQEKLKLLAESVSGWGNCNQAWLDTSEDNPAAVVGNIDEDGETYPVMVVDCDQYFQGQDSLKLAKFYAAANPKYVMELLSILDAQAKRIEELEKDANRYRWLKNHGYANEKNASNAVIGDSKKARVAFRYWCQPQMVDELIDAAMLSASPNYKE